MAVRITRMSKRRLGDVLRAEGLITDEQLQTALQEQRRSNIFLVEALSRLGYVTEDAVAGTIAQQFGLPYLSAEQYDIGLAMADFFPQGLLYEYQFIPLDKVGDLLVIACAGLFTHDMLAELEHLSGLQICQYVSTLSDVRRAIERLYRGYEPKKNEDELSSLGKMLFEEGGEGMAALMTEGATPSAAAPSAETPATAKPAGAPASRFSAPARVSAFTRPRAAGAPATESLADEQDAQTPPEDKPKAPPGGLLKFLKE